MEQTDLRKLPGVLEVEKWPDMRVSEESRAKQQEALHKVDGGWKPQSHEEYQDHLAAIRNRWELEDPPCLTITINLKAPSSLTLYALEFLILICKAELGISDNNIDDKMIRKYLKAWKLKQQGASDEQIADAIPVREYKLKDKRRSTLEMAEADQEIDGETKYKRKELNTMLKKLRQ